MKKALAIINPISGTGSKKSIPDLLAQAYNASEYELFLTYTKLRGTPKSLLAEPPVRAMTTSSLSAVMARSMRWRVGS